MPREIRSVLFVINSPFSTRDYVSAPLFENLVTTVRKHGLVPVFSSYETAIKNFVEDNGAEFEPLVSTGDGLLRSKLWKVRNRYLFRSATYRHNEVNQFAHHERFKKITHRWGRSGHSAIRPHDVWPAYLGFPFARSSTMLGGLSTLLGSGLFNHSKRIERVFEDKRPVLVVIVAVQWPISFSYIHYASSANVPVIGVIGSWDHLTKNGPVPRSISECWVWNETMRQEAVNYHGMNPERVQILGASQFDQYRVQPAESDIQALQSKLGLESDQEIITFAANTNPRGVGEPSIVQHLADKLRAGELGLGKESVIVVRSHPFDVQFEERFGRLRSHKNVRLWEATQVKRSPVEEMRKDSRLMNALLKQSRMLICGQGTPAIDAAFADLPAINIAFDGTEDVPAELGVRYRYEVDHYRKLVAMNGTTVVESFDELDAAVREYDENPRLKSEGRERIRAEFAGTTSSKPASDRISERLDQVLAEL